MKSLENRVAVITGGASGIGKATAIKFISEGAAVAIWDVAVEKGRELEKELEGTGARVKFYAVDTADLFSVETATRQTIADFSKIDILVNNAGITRDASLQKMTREQWDSVISINLTGVFNCTKAITPDMIARGWGRVLNASSIIGLYGNFGQANYAASKAGLVAMTKTWAKELGRKGITVNAVAPGFILTEMVQAVPADILEKTMEKIPLQRMGKPEEVAELYAFLASDRAAYINGTVISIDGGITL